MNIWQRGLGGRKIEAIKDNYNNGYDDFSKRFNYVSDLTINENFVIKARPNDPSSEVVTT